MGWTVRGSNPGGGEIFRTRPNRPWCPPDGYRVFHGGKERPGRDADSLLVPWSRKSRAKPLHPLWAVLPVQSPSACTRVHFTFTLPICKERKAVGQKPKSVSALRKAICRLLWQNCVSLTSTSIKQNKINIIEPAFVSQNTQH